MAKNGRRRMPRKSSARNKSLSRLEKRELDVKISFLEGIVRRDPAFIEALQLLGDCLAQRGRYAESLKVDQRLVELEPDNPMAFYNLACSYALCSELDRAAAALQQAINLGYRDFKWLSRDPDLRPLRKHPLYRPIQDRIRRMKVRIA
jgi:tetratricopeptide (TPR) repeat protein